MTSVGLTTIIPMDGDGWHDPIYAADKVYAESQIPPIRQFKFVSPGLAKTMGTPLIAGRDFTWTDAYEKRPVAMVSENLARELWQTPSAAIGKRIRENLKAPVATRSSASSATSRDDGVNQKAPATVLWPVLMQNFAGNDTFVARSLALHHPDAACGVESLHQGGRPGRVVRQSQPAAGQRAHDAGPSTTGRSRRRRSRW